MAKIIDTIIVGGGLSGLTVAHKLKLKNKLHKLLIIDQAKQLGGAIKTHSEDGFISEIGPHGFLDNNEASQLILAETGLDKEVIKAPLIDFVRYVYLNGKLNMIPQTPLKIAVAPLIPWKDKFRVLGELFKKPLEGHPTVAKWTAHRFGKALLPYLDAVYTGTYAGDYNALSIDAVMPGIRALEKQHGSIIKGLLTKAVTKNKSGNKKKFTMPAMTSFPTGMGRLPEKLAEQFSAEEICLNTEITRIARGENGWGVLTKDGQEFHATNLVLAVPINTALKLLKPLDTGMPIDTIPEAWIVSVILGFANTVLPPGFGFLTPEIEQRFSLGCMFTSNMFQGRAPEGHVVMETLVGGKRHPERVKLSDEELIENAMTDMQDILDLPKEHAYARVLRSNSGIPQLEKGYPELLAWRDVLVKNHPGLHVCGFGWEGIGLNEMMKTGTTVALAIQQAKRSGSGTVEIKGIYF